MSLCNCIMRTLVNSLPLSLAAMALAAGCALPAPPDGGPPRFRRAEGGGIQPGLGRDLFKPGILVMDL